MKEKTTNSDIKSHLRRMWLRSPERAKALKEQNYTCQCCGIKQSKAKGREVKVEVHHKEGILNWEEINNAIYKNLLCDSNKLQVLCKDCHKIESAYKQALKEGGIIIK